MPILIFDWYPDEEVSAVDIDFIINIAETSPDTFDRIIKSGILICFNPFTE